MNGIRIVNVYDGANYFSGQSDPNANIAQEIRITTYECFKCFIVTREYLIMLDAAHSVIYHVVYLE